MHEIKELRITPLSMVTNNNLQKIDFEYNCGKAMHLLLSVFDKNKVIVKNTPIVFDSGMGTASVLLPASDRDFNALWRLTDKTGTCIYETVSMWRKPTERTIYVMVSSHTDIGLHNPPYVQRYTSSRFIDEAMRLCDKTDKCDENNKYRYTVEGTWFWNNYGMDKGSDNAENIVEKYIKRGKIGVCCGVAGNHIQTYGLEEMCRSTYEKKRLYDSWDILSETMTMIDNNGLPMSMIQAYTDAGYKNIIFSPNQWNPLASTVWNMDRTYSGCQWSSEANGGGARIDIRYTSELPMVFWWEDKNHNRLLVWGCVQYDNGAEEFGLYHNVPFDEKNTVPMMEQRISKKLPLMDEKYPYNVWLITCYGDDEEPDTNLLNYMQAWNSKWKFPKIRTLGNPDAPFNILKKNFSDKIPVIRGDITGGWYQHPVSAPDLLSKKFEADRLLPTAEKWSVIACLIDKNHSYPTTDFKHAWDSLLYNDEHSYGTSGYQGRRVYETWLQHIDWIDKAMSTGKKEAESALRSIAKEISSKEDKTVIFNQTLQNRTEYVENDKGYVIAEIPPMGYKAVAKTEFLPFNRRESSPQDPPVIENRYYKVKFSANGSIKSVFDKVINREIADCSNLYSINEMVYTNDNHKTFFVPQKAEFKVIEEAEKTTVIVKTAEEHLNAEIIQTITILNYEKRIDIDNRLYHVKDMINTNRYYRYIYFAFPFMVENAKRYCHLNGTVAEYAKDTSGHGTDVYMAVNEWCCSENDDYGAALIMLDSQLIEYDHIHPDKTDFGNTGDGSQIFAYTANDWLQMYCPGGSHLNYRFRYSITSYKGSYKSAQISKMAERCANPVNTVDISSQKGTLNENEYSFMKANTLSRLIDLKRADDGQGIIARFYGDYNDIVIKSLAGKCVTSERNTIDERPFFGNSDSGFITLRLGRESIRLPERPNDNIKRKKRIPSPIGSKYTGLVTNPQAIRGEKSGHLYLLWGHNVDKDFSHYKLYRSEKADFEANEDTFVANISPEEYVVGRYEDTGLKEHTLYYYKVCAVNKDGIMGEMSKEFSAYTKEEI